MNVSIEENPIFDLENRAVSSLSAQAHAGEKYLGFSLQNTLYAIAVKQVAEVIHPAAVTPLPKTPRWISGIAHLRGEIISVIDLLEFWNIKQTAGWLAKTKLIRLRSPDNSVAFAAERVREIIVLRSEEIEPAENFPYLIGKIAYQTEVLHLIDAEQILSEMVISPYFCVG